MDEILKEIEGYGIVPVVRIEKATDALPLGNALCEGGLPLAEITFRTAEAEEVIRTLTERVSGLIYGLHALKSDREALEFAVAASCLKYSMPGDLPLLSVGEVQGLVGGVGSGRVQR